MSGEKLFASMDHTLLAEARATAEAEGLSLSAWLADAVADRLRLNALRELVEEWEAEHGVITSEERAEVDQDVAEAGQRAHARRTAAEAAA